MRRMMTGDVHRRAKELLRSIIVVAVGCWKPTTTVLGDIESSASRLRRSGESSSSSSSSCEKRALGCASSSEESEAEDSVSSEPRCRGIGMRPC